MSYSYSPVEDTERGRKDKACMNIIGSKEKVKFFILLVGIFGECHRCYASSTQSRESIYYLLLGVGGGISTLYLIIKKRFKILKY